MTLLAAALLPQPSRAQTASEIIDRAVRLHDQRMEGISDYSVVETVVGAGFSGSPVTLRFDRTMVEGHPVFIADAPTPNPSREPTDSAGRQLARGGLLSPGAPLSSGADRQGVVDAAASLATLRDRTELRGSEEVDDHDCWILEVDDPDALADAGAAPDSAPPGPDTTGASSFHPESLSLALDKDSLVLRRMSLTGVMESETGEARDLSLTTRVTDYRRVDGVFYPFVTESEVSGLSSSSLSPEQRKKMQEDLARTRKTLEEMPAQQRAMVEKMMGPKIRKWQAMLDEDRVTVRTEVQQLHVDRSPPASDDRPGVP